jgi:serine/threonine-protein kinase
MIQDYERQRRIESYFQEALDAAPGQRASVVARLCGGDRELEAAVEELLRHHDEGGTSAPMDPGRVLGPVAEPTAPVPGAAREATTADFVGRTIGPFRLIRELGSGGMGRVFLAERVDLPRRVALKLVREPLASPERTSRFELEQRVLARLEHPAIAQLFDAGVTEDGAPWFAMEFVEGAPITAYCDRGRLTVDARIRLVLSVLDAVQYSHARLIVHRDLKPSNILVAAGGMPKLVDFGIAKLLDDQEDPGLTRTGLLMLTPSYAAPEQFAGGPVTTATDVYQIGAVLYELLTGATPFETGGRSLSEIERDIRTIEPKPPSSRVTEARTASERGTSPDRLRRRLRGDLDHIVAKALEKDPARRYASAADMAEDLRLFLAHEPVAARAQTPLERSRRFLRRHRVAAGVAAALLIYAATASIGLVRISAERDRAQREADTATRVSDFLVGVFAAADPSDTTTGDPSIDIDHFKSYNDELGNEAGNEALIAVGRVLTDSLRQHDVCARYGGEEFALVLSETTKPDAREVAERTRQSVEQHIEDIAGIKLKHNHNLTAPKGVNGRNSDNTKITEYLGWAPGIRLRDGMKKTYDWIYGEYMKQYAKQPA